ncbi:hypothetical protein ABEW34_16340 [Paenibacillus algorifonticola]|uniref:hypothetical protein n=1 Tax=Paenibacillus algorifonticola TaxID=684063 RepID=UPI003D2E1161
MKAALKLSEETLKENAPTLRCGLSLYTTEKNAVLGPHSSPASIQLNYSPEDKNLS